QIAAPRGTKLGKSSKRRHPGDEGSSSETADAATTVTTTLLVVRPTSSAAVADVGIGDSGRDLLASAALAAEAPVGKLAASVVVRAAAPDRYGVVLDLPASSAGVV